MKMFLRILLMLGLLVLAGSALAERSKSIVHTKHNLSSTGTGDIKSPTESRVCIFCHSSHNTSTEGPLWNRETSAPGKFRTYSRSTMASTPEQPNGATKLCLSCHDGTIAVGSVMGRRNRIPMSNVGAAGEIPSTRKSNMGHDLSTTHPVSVKYEQSTSMAVKHLRWPPLDAEKKVGPDADGYVQCTSCHDPHDDSKSTRYPFWQKATFDEVCLTCHEY